MRALTLAVIAAWLTGCTTFALIGNVAYERTDDRGVRHSERVVGLLACPTPRGNTFVLLPLYKSSAPGRRGGDLPPTVQRWMQEQAPTE